MNKFLKMFIGLFLIVITVVAVFLIKTKPEFKTAVLRNLKLTDIKAERIITPEQARNFLNDLDMPTRDYEDTGYQGNYGKYEADSDRLILETRDPNRYLNNLTYSVFGDKDAAKAVSLDLNVNDVSYSSNAVGELIKYSDGLMKKATGENLTPEIKKAMETKTVGEWVVNGYKIKLTKAEFQPDAVKDDYQTSDVGAFELTFLIEI